MESDRRPRVAVLSGVASPFARALYDTDLDMALTLELAASTDLLSQARRFASSLRQRGGEASPSAPIVRVASVADPALPAALRDHDIDILVVYRVPRVPAESYAPVTFALNVHPSLLPSYRGGHPLLAAIWDDRAVTGTTVHLLTDQLDHGPIVTQGAFRIPPGVRERELEHTAVIEVGVPLVERAVYGLWSGTAQVRRQPIQSPTVYARRRPRRQVYEQLPFADWPIERVWNVLRYLDLSPLEQHPLWRHLTWEVGDIEHESGEGEPGQLQTDENGPYVSHPEGRIRLHLKSRWTAPIRIPAWALGGDSART